MKRLLVPLLAVLACAPLAAADGRASDGPRIRVAIARNSPFIRLKTSAKVYVVEAATGKKYLLLENAAYEIKPSAGGIAVAGQQLSSPIKLVSPEGAERIRLGGKLYKGDIVIHAVTSEGLDVVEHLSLEEYLYGVLPVEMSPDWPLEALKAQAVASRTYALKYINPARDYDVTDGVEKQVYTGAGRANARILEAVNSTRGEVLKYKGKLITAFFHACCGGHTASSKSAWGQDVLKPLYGVQDPFCAPSRHSRWEVYASSSDLLKFIQSSGSTALKIKSVRVYKKDRSGRAVTLRFATDRGARDVSVNELRKHLGNTEFRSALITRVTPVKGGYEFGGRGWGHGVGMCQEGAKYMALKGRPYKKILRHYYPSVTITDYE
ncbi:MAG: SpoIID/LytB domain-containing protein [Elusimicrobiales bacterium]|nr:SpoIID/LytB domain-containing protein [Elusimicrobiales bacterium]